MKLGSRLEDDLLSNGSAMIDRSIIGGESNGNHKLLRGKRDGQKEPNGSFSFCFREPRDQFQREMEKDSFAKNTAFPLL